MKRSGRPFFCRNQYYVKWVALPAGICTAIVLTILFTILLTSCGSKGEKPMQTNAPQNEAWRQDPYRPQYHYSNIENWANDPNGLLYYEGEYHFFYQYNPNGNFDGHKHWAHAVSADLINWTDLPLALCPDDLGDCWSGSMVADDNNTSGFFTGCRDENGNLKEHGLVAIYTGFTYQITQCIAYSADNGRTWTKYEGNPVIDQSNNPGGSAYFRDPKVFWHEESGQWMMVISGGPLMIYTSPDLKNWTCQRVQTGIQTECPDLFPITAENTGEEKWVLTLSGRYYMVGSLTQRGDRWMFRPQTQQIPMNFGPDAYATQAWSNSPDGRILTISWMNSMDYVTALPNVLTKFSGIYTLIQELRLIETDDGYRLLQTPAREYMQLRSPDKAFSVTKLSLGSEDPLYSFYESAQCECIAEFRPSPDVTAFGLKLRVGTDQETVLRYDCAAGTLTLDRSQAGVSPAEAFSSPGTYSADIALTKDGVLKLQIFLDRSTLEVFVNGGAAVGSMLHFPDAQSTGMAFFTEGGSTEISCTVYQMHGIGHLPAAAAPASEADPVRE